MWKPEKVPFKESGFPTLLSKYSFIIFVQLLCFLLRDGDFIGSTYFFMFQTRSRGGEFDKAEGGLA